MNEWTGIAKEAKKIQNAKNRVLNGKLLNFVHQYAPSRGKAFDYGCGWGEFAEALTKDGFDVEAFDAADEMVEEARTRYQRPHFYTRAEFTQKLPELEHNFDLVTSNLVLCILTQSEQDEMLENVKRIAKSGAPLIISFCNPCTDYLTIGVVSKRLRSHTWNPKYDKEFKYRKVIHENKIEFTDYHRPLEYYSTLFKKHGLEILDIAESEVLNTEALPDFIIFVLRNSESQGRVRNP